MNSVIYEYCVISLSQRFPYESLSFLVNNHFTQVAFDLARALVPSQTPNQYHDTPLPPPTHKLYHGLKQTKAVYEGSHCDQAELISVQTYPEIQAVDPVLEVRSEEMIYWEYGRPVI